MMNNISNNSNIGGNNNKTNIFAILGFIFSFIFSIAGLILSIIGLNKSKEYNDGKVLSIVGIIISSIKIVITTLAITLLIVGIIGVQQIIDTVNENNNTSESNYCEKAYNCVSNENGTYQCYYDEIINGIETPIEIICNYKEIINKNDIELEKVSGIWKPEIILDEFNNEINVAKYYGLLENVDKKIELELSFASLKSYNYLLGYEDENDIVGTYYVKDDKVYITNNNNKITILDIKYDENNRMYLVLHYDKLRIYLYNK